MKQDGQRLFKIGYCEIGSDSKIVENKLWGNVDIGGLGVEKMAKIFGNNCTGV